MRTRRTITIIILLSLANLARADLPELQTQRDLHQATLAELNARWELGTAQLTKAYFAELDRAKERAKAGGNPAVRFEAEDERLRVEQSEHHRIYSEDEAPDWILRLRQPYIKNEVKLAAGLKASIDKQTALYLEVLEGMKQRLAEQDRPTHAQEVEQEQSRIRNAQPDSQAPATAVLRTEFAPKINRELARDLSLYYSFDEDNGRWAMGQGEFKRNGKSSDCRWNAEGASGGCFEFIHGRKPRMYIYNRGSGGDVWRSPNIDNGFSVSTFVRLAPNPPKRRMCLIGNVENSGFALMFTSDQRPFFRVHVGDGYIDADFANPCEPETWYHLAGVVQGHSVQLFLNGQLVSAKRIDLDQRLRKGRERMMLGGNPGGNWRSSDHFFGRLDEVAVWRRPLSPGEVRLLYSLRTSN